MWRATSWEGVYTHYLCGCGKEWGIEDMYFCFQCTKPLCVYCVTEEIDSFYCRNCMENMPTTEAMAFKNRCSRCFQCPVCFTTLQILLNNSSGQKQYHFGCQHCYWDSLTLGLSGTSLNELLMSNQTHFTKDNPLQQAVQKLQETYKVNLRNRKKVMYRHVAREIWTLEDLQKSLSSKETIEPTLHEPKQSETLDFLLSENFEYFEKTDIDQRLTNLSTQPQEVNEATAQPLPLLTKRSKRCKHCRKYVVKPETLPNYSNPFKMENLLVYFFPKILVREIGEDFVALVFVNPTSSVSYMKILNMGLAEGEVHLNAYDPIMDLVTAEGSSENEAVVQSREKNKVVINLPRESKDLFFDMVWKFSRGTEIKEVNTRVHIHLT